ncbi:hypothetical protein DSCA_26290 [Desulfosarcina alkanivorans]|uniref:YwbE family protein n=1 Tax=Desulfosarcina alkanivorans TaxID=571177 RepID=A0A5K7YLD9_9BACT|nr:YwbE family protein [Desulfosarcina alkanivorans]BBO68699.1 hypothetical protein DSCA_26290 [Desulfosarcina alkanivorans]
MDGRYRKNIRPGDEVNIVLKADQRSGRLTRGTVREMLTRSPSHPHGIKVRLTDGRVGRVREVLKTPQPPCS